MTETKQTLVRLAEQHHISGHLIGPVKRKKGDLWVQYLREHDVELSSPMEEVARRQASAKNAMKPIGLFMGDDSLVAKQDSSLPAKSLEKKCQSFIESWYFWGCKVDKYDQVSLAVIIPGTAKVLDASALSPPVGRQESLVQYVEDQVRKIS